jgi:sec-independent protein translocase protein TatA
VTPPCAPGPRKTASQNNEIRNRHCDRIGIAVANFPGFQGSFWPIIRRSTTASSRGNAEVNMGIGMRELIIILLVVLLVFGAKKLRTIGTDLGAAVKGFKKSMGDGDAEESLGQIKHQDADAEFPEVAVNKARTEQKSSDQNS